ncbi:MAG: hypothetical protein C4527_22045 [Candidatus Omnitrophota bacterium]|nr:MAG: hypothetical protein C4527_22045 [Candidatus Omnitrophota bacterium]
MLNTFKIYSKPFVLLAFFALVSLSAFAAGEITLIKDLVNDVEDAVWTDGNDNPISFDNPESSFGIARRGIKFGGVNGTPISRDGGETFYDEAIKADVIDVEFASTLGRAKSQVRGSYILSLSVTPVPQPTVPSICPSWRIQASPIPPLPSNVFSRNGVLHGIDTAMEPPCLPSSRT